jgi:hypothetical protein
MTMRRFRDSTEIQEKPQTLNARLDEDGYLFVGGLVPRADVEAVGRSFLEIVADGGWLQPGTAVEDRIADPAKACVDPEERFLSVFRRFWQRQSTHELKHHPAIVGFFERLFGEAVLVHPLFVARNIFPQREEFTTRPHQDYVHIQGTARTYTVWLPLHDVPGEMGGLAVAEGSHRAGVHSFTVAKGAGGLETDASFEGAWRTGPFRAGDALIFHSMAVHQGRPNLTPCLRHSLDARYQRASEPISEVSMKPYSGCGTWEEVYAGWDRDALKYYWRKFEPAVLPFDYQYYDRRDEIAYAMAERGDETARAALMRIVQRDPREAKRTRASRLLESLDRQKVA